MYLEVTLDHLGCSIPSSTEEAWDEFREFVRSAKDAEVPPYRYMQTFPLAAYKAEDAVNKACRLLALAHQKPLIESGTIHESYLPSQSNLSISDSYWSQGLRVDPPFIQRKERVCKDFNELDDFLQTPIPRESNDRVDSSDQEARKIRAYALLHGAKDAATATRLISLEIEEDSILHEIGCWGGENSINSLMYCKATRGKFPDLYIGTDINPEAVSMSAMTFRAFKFRFNSAFYVSNSTLPLGISPVLRHHKITVLALRVIPIFDRTNAEKFLKQINKEWKGRNLSLIVSYAVPSGSIYQRNLLKLKDETLGVQRSYFSGGSCFTQKYDNHNERVVLQTYYDTDAFNKLAKDSGFRVEGIFPAKDLDSAALSGTSDPFIHREVAILSPLK